MVFPLGFRVNGTTSGGWTEGGERPPFPAMTHLRDVEISAALPDNGVRAGRPSRASCQPPRPPHARSGGRHGTEGCRSAVTMPGVPTAACRRAGVDPFTTNAQERQAVLACCVGCPIRAECIGVWKANPVGYGVWAGRTGEQLLVERAPVLEFERARRAERAAAELERSMQRHALRSGGLGGR